MSQDSIEQRAEHLILQLIPADSEKRVQQAVKRFSPVLRELIRSETGLRLSDGLSRASLPVRVVDGMPSQLADVIARKPDPLLWRLLALRGQFEESEKTLKALEGLYPAISNWVEAPEGLRDLMPGIQPTRQAVALLAKLKNTEAIEDGICQIQEDLLGCYFYPKHSAPSIEIYWMPIALIAQTINVTPEDLAIVVLTHELAHGYTHIGRDIDGEVWDREIFAQTSKEVKEGLAQHYTEAITTKLGLRAPKAHEAYEKFLKLQRGPYLVHQDWLKAHFERRGEAVRVAMLAARRAEPMSHDAWLALLNRMSVQLRNGGRPGITVQFKTPLTQQLSPEPPSE